MNQVDGCPNCVLNVEPPLCEVPVENGVRCAYMCTDCGHYWTTDWAAESLARSRIPGCVDETIGAQQNEPQPRYLAVRNWGSTDQTLGA